MTLGANGALLAGPDGIELRPAMDVPVRSAVGAGDAFVGALVCSLAQGNPMAEAFRLGIAAGAAAVTTPGMELASKDDVYALYGRQMQVAE